ncbi:contractile injection system tape measure protein [Reichenbachiella sp.]|uniref:contractile injection system tape measure protein n=1 Tax=Reichenbachiella sp. TaxID=2184521 RepID=UPI003BAEFD76
MASLHNHIVSKVSWETSFCDAHEAVALQNQISNWARTKLGNEMKSVLDDICPDDQVWTIDSLELDLGTIEYARLPEELSQKFSKALSDQLQGLMLSHTGGKNRIHSSSPSQSYFSIIEHFLTKGYMPWWHKQESGHAGDIMTMLLKEHQLAIADKIRQVGQAAQVRRRLTQQFGDDILRKILKSLELYNHQPIFDAIESICTLQKRKKWMLSSDINFRKEAWFWVFNYLLTERKTLFSKTSLMQSMLTQMASKFNLIYADLVRQINTSVESENMNGLIAPELTRVISVLTQEVNPNKQQVDRVEVSHENPWSDLSFFFDTDSSNSKNASIPYVREILTAFSTKEKVKLRKWLLKLNKSTPRWNLLLNLLDEPTYAAVVYALCSVQSGLLVAHSNLIADLLQKHKVVTGQKLIWGISLKYAIKSTGDTPPNNTTEYILKEISKVKKTPLDQLLGHAQRSPIWSQPKSKQSLLLFQELKTIQGQLSETLDTRVLDTRIRGLLNQVRKVNYRLSDAPSAYEQLNNWIVSNTGQVYSILKNYFEKEEFPELFLHHLDIHSTESLIKAIGEGYFSIIQEFDRQINKWCSQKENHSTSYSPTKQALKILLDSPKASKKEVMVTLIQGFSQSLTAHDLASFKACIEETLSTCKDTNLTFSADEMSRLDNILASQKEEGFLIKTHVLIASQGSNQISVGNFLLANFDDDEFTSARISEPEDLELILNFFIPKGIKMKRKVVRKVIGQLDLQTNTLAKEGITQTLNDLFWKSALTYKEHWGNQEALQKSVEKAAAFYFHQDPNPIRTNREDASDSIKLKNGNTISTSQLKSVVSMGIKQCALKVEYEKDVFSLEECLNQLIAIDLQALTSILSQINPNDNSIQTLKKTIDFGDFALYLQSESRYCQSMEAIRSLFLIVNQQAPEEVKATFLVHFWKEAWELISNGSLDRKPYFKLVRSAILEIHESGDREPLAIMKDIQSSSIPVNSILREALIATSEVFELLPADETSESKSKNLVKCEDKNLIEALCESIFRHQEVPAWYRSENHITLTDTLIDLFRYHPVSVLKQLKSTSSVEQKVTWLASLLSMRTVVNALSSTEPNQHGRLQTVSKMHDVFGSIPLTGSPSQVQEILIKKVLTVWRSNNWELLSSDNIWNELIWEVCVKNGHDPERFKTTIEDSLARFPSELQLSFRQLNRRKGEMDPQKSGDQKLNQTKDQNQLENMPLIKEEIMVQNAGQVILSTYIKMLFERLELTVGDQFRNETCQQEAAHYLQYVVTGWSKTEESHLTLNKVLCGLHPHVPIIDGIHISDENKQLIDGLIQAAIGHWPEIGTSSIEGFRGNWLVRDGMLSEDDERWNLVVEKRAYDLLLNQSPFSFSIIKYPWMDKPLHVNWPF